MTPHYRLGRRAAERGLACVVPDEYSDNAQEWIDGWLSVYAGTFPMTPEKSISAAIHVLRSGKPDAIETALQFLERAI